MPDLTGKHIVNSGIATRHSFCWGAAQKIDEAGGAQTLLCYPADLNGVRKLATSLKNVVAIMGCDWGNPVDVDATLYTLLKKAPYHGFLQGVAWAHKDDLAGKFIHMKRENMLRCFDISVLSLVRLGSWAEEAMTEGGSILWLTYAASKRTLPHYGPMALSKGAGETAVIYMAADLGECGIRVNAISANPIMSRAARGIKDFRFIGDHDGAKALLGGLADTADVGDEIVHLFSDRSRKVTAQVRFVDCGVDTVNIVPKRNARKAAKNYTAIADKVDAEAAGLKAGAQA